MGKTASFILNKDKELFYLINKSFKCKLLDILMPYITMLGGVSVSASIPLILIILGKGSNRILGYEILLSLTISTIFVQLIKRKTSRLRPYDIFDDINNFNIVLKDYSFPSGHTTGTFSIAIVVGMNIPTFMVSITALAMLVGISRIYLGVHHPSDVAVGIFLGSITSYMIHPYFIIL
ncbi:phosphatase PAP2 family protein [Clostridium sp. D2Q-11]|uniref:Phosphatase PAP2 family protein n=1 Tax=Anaeromonas frigoriresistens TaxID=2683708 RepID=A0A942V0U9_9FIRM|nr:phosphatase PAP2 family protein [Anaeromonas frigoriresistens]MBS4539112.1 phosphatase PAP2 family protein [Anaeromonas frigoriresistens]